MGDRRFVIGSSIIGLAIIVGLAFFWQSGTRACAQGVTAPPAITPEEAFRQGCANCHPQERRVLRAIPTKSDDERRAWLQTFLAGHPCEHAGLQPLVIDYLVAKTKK